MLQKHLLLSTLICWVPVSSLAWYAEDADPTTVGPIVVSISDDAEGGCWTNLGEVKTYAEDKLRLEGYIVGEERRWNTYIFDVYINAFRHSNGSCIGSYRVSVFKASHSEGIIGYFEIGNVGGVATNSRNFNQYTLDAVSDMVSQM